MIGKRILAPVNLEEASLDVLHFVAGLAGEVPVCATLLYVSELNIYAPEPRVYDELCLESERRLRSLAKLFFERHPPSVCVRFGKPHEEILAEAEAEQTELIIMASPKSPRPKWRFRPTTVEGVVRKASCMTLVLPRAWKITREQHQRVQHSAWHRACQPEFN